MDAACIETPPYRSVRQALASSFAQEVKVICKSPMLMGSRAGANELTPWDRAAQSAIVIRLLHENCHLHVIAAVSAQFMPLEITRPRGILIGKHEAIDICTREVATYPHLGGYPLKYLRDVVCFWADAPMSQTEPEWMDEMGKSSRMLRYIKFGNARNGKPGVCQLLDDLLRESDEVLGEVFLRRGIV